MAIDQAIVSHRLYSLAVDMPSTRNKQTQNSFIAHKEKLKED